MSHSDTKTQGLYFRVKVHYKDANRPLVYEHANMTYVKDVFYCVQIDGYEFKHPIANIWRIVEEGAHTLEMEGETNGK